MLNRKTKETYADSTFRTWTYDRDGLVTDWADARDVRASMTYDDLNRMTQRDFDYGNADPVDLSGTAISDPPLNDTHAEGVTQQFWYYDGLSRVVSSDDNDASTSCSFDSLSRCISETQAAGGLSRTTGKTYDANSNRTSVVYPSNGGSLTATYTMDSLDRVSAVAFGGSTRATYSFYGPGRIKQRTAAQGGSNITTDYSYDAGRRVVAIEHGNLLQPDGTTAVTLDFFTAYDREGTVIAENADHENLLERGFDVYQYDSAYRLIAEYRDVDPQTLPTNNTAPNPSTPTIYGDKRLWGLDGVSNWVTVDDGSTTTNRGINPVNEYTSVGSTDRGHDANGNLVYDGTFVYYWDALNRLVRVERDDGVETLTTIATNEWDTKNRRVYRWCDDSVSGVDEDLVFFHAGGQIIEEWDVSGTAALERRWIFGGSGERLFRREDSSDFVLLEKLNGSIVSQADPSRELVAYWDYKAYGLVESEEALGSLFFNKGNIVAVDAAAGHYFAFGMRQDLEGAMLLQDREAGISDTKNGEDLNGVLEGKKRRDGPNGNVPAYEWGAFRDGEPGNALYPPFPNRVTQQPFSDDPEDCCLESALGFQHKDGMRVQGAKSLSDFVLRTAVKPNLAFDLTTTGRQRQGRKDFMHKVHFSAKYSGRPNCGVDQSFSHSADSSDALLDQSAAALGMPTGSTCSKGVRYQETFVKAGGGIFDNTWSRALPFNDSRRRSMLGWGDYPVFGLQNRGTLSFITCFVSRRKSCKIKRACVFWDLRVDTLSMPNSKDAVRVAKVKQVTLR